MQFRTKINVKEPCNSINYKSQILLIGSCFTQNIGDKLNFYNFKNFINPFGILFTPTAIEKLLISALENKKYTNDKLVFNNEEWHCLDTHSNFSHPNKEVVLDSINTSLIETKTYIKNTSHLIITLGTSWVYRYNETANLVANCHKIPQKQFSKEILSIPKIVQSLQNIVDVIKKTNPKTKIIFTVSPVRHLKDGFIENQQSKAHLLAAIHQISAKNVSYFPAYEIMMDDLRDYRFYKKDMLHPNEVAIDYIWDKFVNYCIESSEKEIMEQVAQIRKGLAHRPFNKDSTQHKKFLEKLQKKIVFLETNKGIVINPY